MITTREMFFLLLIVGSFAIANSLVCTTCGSDKSWDDCEKNAKNQTCTLDAVNEAHAEWNPTYNPTLVQGTEQDEFQCYAIEAVLKNPGGNESATAFGRDCTFKKVEFCKGWVDGVEVIKCGTNPSGDVDLSGGSAALSAMGALIVAAFLGVYLRM